MGHSLTSEANPSDISDVAISINKKTKFGANVPTNHQTHSKKKQKKNKHIKFDEDGNPMVAKHSKVLPKVKTFLKVSANNISSSKTESDVVFSSKDPYELMADVNVLEESGEAEVCAEEERERSPERHSGSSNCSTNEPATLDVPENGARPNSEPLAEDSIHGMDEENNSDTDSGNRDPVCYADIDMFCENEEGKTDKKKQKKKKKKKKKAYTEKFRVPMPSEVADNPVLCKYWAQRYRLFSRFDEGIQLDTGKKTARVYSW